MKRIVFFVNPEVFDAYVAQRGASVFDVIVAGFKKELGNDAVKKVEVFLKTEYIVILVLILQILR